MRICDNKNHGNRLTLQYEIDYILSPTGHYSPEQTQLIVQSIAVSQRRKIINVEHIFTVCGEMD